MARKGGVTFIMRNIFLIIFCLSVSIKVIGQSSMALNRPEFYFRDGLEMVEKSNFTAARTSFQNFIQSAPSDSRVPEARYYLAFSALNLYNLDAEQS